MITLSQALRQIRDLQDEVATLRAKNETLRASLAQRNRAIDAAIRQLKSLADTKT